MGTRAGAGTRRGSVGLAAALIMVATATGCSGNGSSDAATGGSTSSGTVRPGTTVVRPDGPAAGVAGPLTGGRGIFLGAASSGPSLATAGYDEAEYSVSGTATSYTAAELPTDGTFELQPGPTADYVTRIVVRRPTKAEDFDGTVAVEWLNVSGGVDAAPDYTYVAPEVLRRGTAWVGVSVQRIGVEGGAVAVAVPGAEAAGAGKGLRNLDPERYGGLHHPGDAFAYDMYTQVARALRAEGNQPMGGLDVQRLVAVGESQSAFMLTTYYNGVQPLAHQYDGFFIHSRGAAPAPLGSPGGGIDIAGSLSGKPTVLRGDQPIPAIVVQTETDLLSVIGYYPARQPDSDHLRVWEVAGTAHADRQQIGEMEAQLGCPTPINRGQQVYVLRAALRHLQSWIVDGTPPPQAPPLETDASGAKPAFVVDDAGNVKGGVRTPVVDVPVAVLSGLSPGNPSIVCLLMGTTTPLPTEQLASRYPSKAAYLDRYTEATDAAIASGFLLPEDRDAVLAEADPSGITRGS